MNRTVAAKTYQIMITPDADDGGFVGRCAELHANSEGDTYDEVIANMLKVVRLAVRESGRSDAYRLSLVNKDATTS